MHEQQPGGHRHRAPPARGLSGTGLVADVDLPLAWVVALRRLAEDDKSAETLRIAARRWVEENYDAHRNTARLVQCFEEATKP